MLILIIGGSASGKSHFAEQLALELSPSQATKTALRKSSDDVLKRGYIATLQSFEKESKVRIYRHQQMRKSKGFETIEWYTHLEQFPCEKTYDVLLLECLSNLVANEWYSPKGSRSHYFENTLKGIKRLKAITHHLIIVSNDVFLEGKYYNDSIEAYKCALAQLNLAIAKEAERVIEVVCGLPIEHKTFCNE